MGQILRRSRHSGSSELDSKTPKFWPQGYQGNLEQVIPLLCALVPISLYSKPTVCQGPIDYIHYFQSPR